MNNNTDTNSIRQCLELIETRWKRGPSGEWRSYDFEKLSDEIFDATGVSLSVSTLKRLFGKVTYNNLPAAQTLNTLARFAGFEDWNTFKGREAVSMEQVANLIPHTAGGATPSRKKTFWWPLLLLPVAGLVYPFLSSTRIPHRGPVNPSAYSFSCNKVLTEGVPNSVVFRYDAAAAPSDSVFIVQTWDMSRRTMISRAGHAHSAIYYYPGYFNAKLVVDTQIVRTRGLMIASGGWLAMAEGDPAPFYFKKEEFARKGGGVMVDSAMLAKNHLPFYPRAPLIQICYVKDMGPLPDDNFTFETTLRCDRSSGAEACQQVEVLLLCKEDVIIIPLSAPACIGDLSLYAQGQKVTSKDTDLSGFGSDLSQWTTLKIETVDRHMRFTLNNKLAYALNFTGASTDIVGVQYRFRGGGSVRDTRFTAFGKTIELR